MKDYSIPSDVLHKEIFRKHPERIAWLVKYLDLCDDEGHINVSHRQLAKEFGTTHDIARHFASFMTEFSPTFRPLFAQNDTCISISCDDVSPTFRPKIAQKENEKKPKRVSKKKEETTLFTRVRTVFEDFVKDRFGEAYYWTPKDAVACNRLIKEITFSRANRPNPLPVDDEGILQGFTSYINSINDKWVLEHFSMPIIAQSFQQIKQQLSLQNGNANIGETPKQSLIKRQKQSIVNKVAEIERRWKQSQGEETEEG